MADLHVKKETRQTRRHSHLLIHSLSPIYIVPLNGLYSSTSWLRAFACAVALSCKLFLSHPVAPAHPLMECDPGSVALNSNHTSHPLLDFPHSS